MSSTLTIIPLGNAHCATPLLSKNMIDIIQSYSEEQKKVLVVYPRRGNARAWICQDCGYYEKCPHCDIALAYHNLPQKKLLCHQCGHISPYSLSCAKCHGSRLEGIGIGIQQLADGLEQSLPRCKILQIHSDTKEKASILYKKIGEYDIILTTNNGSSIVHPDISAVFFPLFELNLAIPKYDIEEVIGNEIRYYKKQGLPIILQTYVPENPLLQELIHGNTKNFLGYIQKERKQFGYPPFSEFASIRIHDENKKKVETLLMSLINKIGILKKSSTFFAFDHDIRERFMGEWQSKIILKENDLSYLINELEVEITRNRNITLEWK